MFPAGGVGPVGNGVVVTVGAVDGLGVAVGCGGVVGTAVGGIGVDVGCAGVAVGHVDGSAAPTPVHLAHNG